jgi:hypothetical protein
MKKLIFLLALAAISHRNVFSQGCLPEGIDFNTQGEIDNFQANYPGCTEIEGDVTISDYSTGSITNLNGLNVLTTIGGSLWIEDNGALTSLTGLEGLTSIGGSFEIFYNSSLATLTGLVGLSSVGNTFWIIGNDALTSLEGLEGLTSTEHNLEIMDNDALKNLTGLEGLTFIDGSFSILDNDSMTTLMGLESLTSIDYDLWIEDNDALTSLTGLEGLTSMGGYLLIQGNNTLTSLAGLENIQLNSWTTLNIFDNSSLGECDVYSICQYLEAPNGTIEIHDNAPGCNSLEEVEEACGFPCLPEGITFSSQGEIDYFQSNYPGCNEIEGDVLINGWTSYITNLNGLNILTAIGGSLYIENTSLTNLIGLENLTITGGSLWIYSNPALTCLIGLEGLTSIGGELEINYNNSLTSLIGIENIQPNSIEDLTITDNPLLHLCEVNSICEYLTAPNGTIEIHDNASGCNSPAEVEAACLTSIEENPAIEGLSIFPNPATSFITINVTGGQPIEEAIIYNHLGLKALEAVPVNNTVDVSTLTPGIYYLEVITSESRSGTKLVID